VKTLRAAHESWNKRDFVGVVGNPVKGLAYTDHGRNITLNTRDKFREWTEGWKHYTELNASYGRAANLRRKSLRNTPPSDHATGESPFRP